MFQNLVPHQNLGPHQKLGPHHIPNKNIGPPRKSHHGKTPKYTTKPVKYSNSMKPSSISFDTYKLQPSGYYHSGGSSLVTDSYGAPKPASYSPPGTTYGKPHPQGSPEPPKKLSGASLAGTKDEPATSYVNVYQGDEKDDGSPTFAYTQSHQYEKKHKGKNCHSTQKHYNTDSHHEVKNSSVLCSVSQESLSWSSKL